MFKALQFHGDRLKGKRNAFGMTIDDLAKRAGISQSYVSGLENGEKNNPSVDVINSLAKELDFDAIYFFEDRLSIEYLPEMDEDLLQFILDPENVEWFDFAKLAKGSRVKLDELVLMISIMEMQHQTKISSSENSPESPSKARFRRIGEIIKATKNG